MTDSQSMPLRKQAEDFIAKNGGIRLVIAGILLAGIQVMLLIDWASERTLEREVDLLVAKTEVERMKALTRVDGLDDIKLGYEDELATYRSRVYRADTAGLAASQIRAVLQEASDRAGLERAQIVVNTEDGTAASLTTFLVEISAREALPGAFALFLGDLKSRPEAVYVASLDYNSRTRTVQMRLTYVAEIGGAS